MQPEESLIVSADGSHTLRSQHFDATYHSKHGAISESRHIFIGAGLDYLSHSKEAGPVTIFEMGFGTGLNALLTAQWSQSYNRMVRYTTIEAYPLNTEITNQLNYGQILKDDNLFSKIHSSPWGEWNELLPSFSMKKIKGKIEDLSITDRYDVIYYDAFGPGAQPLLWERPVLQKIYDMTADGGVLTSFCVQGTFRRTLMAVGYQVEKLPGPPGKREITRAKKP